MIAGTKKRGGQFAEMAAQMEAVYRDYPDGSFTPGEKLTDAEISADKDTIEALIRQLELEVAEYVQQQLAKGSE
jgi:hypothetical protein